MTLPVADYILRAQIANHHIRYFWDEWHVNDYFLDIDEDWFDRLDLLSDAANLSLCIGCGEWIEHRLSVVNDDPRPGDYLEAAWAAIVHPNYCAYIENKDDDWRGSVRGPLNIMMSIIHDGIHCRETDEHEASRVCWMYNLAKHVLPDTADFVNWFETCVERLEKHHPWVDNDDIWEEGLTFGIPVPRDALDPGRTYDPSAAPNFIDQFLRRLNPLLNPYLTSPDELSADPSFRGSTYRYAETDWAVGD
jgi:hypothetical protein